MATVGVIVGVWFASMGVYGVTNASRSPERGAAHWTSTPPGRRVGGTLTIALGLALVVASLTLP